MCGIAGFSLEARSTVPRTAAARVLLAGIAERGADAAGFAYRDDGAAACVHKQQSGASALLGHVELPETTRHLLMHVRDYTKGHPTIETNNHPIRHGAVVGVHNGIIVNDEELFERHGWTRAHPDMTVDSEAIFALVEETDEAYALEELHGSMATAWIDERRPDGLVAARGVGRPLWLGHGRHETFFASTKRTLELIERYLDLRLSKREVPEGSRVRLGGDGDVEWASFQPAEYVEESPLPAVRTPEERESCLRLLPALVAAAL
jgi:glucosamine 6-phosphate synthetase-like amidotransferase/phosphosugar isomerase protein